MLLTAWSVGERRVERVAMSICRLVCWCISLWELLAAAAAAAGSGAGVYQGGE